MQSLIFLIPKWYRWTAYIGNIFVGNLGYFLFTGWNSWLPLETAERRLEAQGKDSSILVFSHHVLPAIGRPGTFWALPGNGVVWWVYGLLELLQKPRFSKVEIPMDFFFWRQYRKRWTFMKEGYACTGQCSRMHGWGPVPHSLRMQWAPQYHDCSLWNSGKHTTHCQRSRWCEAKQESNYATRFPLTGRKNANPKFPLHLNLCPSDRRQTK